jgi:ParB/RepB/Spo0J family partition protein
LITAIKELNEMSTGVAIPTGKLKKIPIGDIRESNIVLREVDRKSEKYVGLVNSIRDRGILNPIVVREVRDENGKLFYGLVDGKHRYSGAQDAGLTEVPANVINMTDADVMEAQVIGNIHRVDTKPVEYSKRLKEIFYANPMMTLSDMATRLAKSPEWVRQRLALTNLPEHVGNLVDEGKITLSNAYSLVDIAKLAPDEINGFLDRAQTLPPTEFAPQVGQRVKSIREARRAGKDPNKVDEYEPVPLVQKPATIRDEFKNPQFAEPVLAAMGATTALDGWKAAIAWTVRMDPLSIEEGRRKYEAEKAAQKEAREKRQAEKAQQRQATAAEATVDATS